MPTIQNCNFDSQPLSQSQTISTPKLPNMAYTNQDFWSLKSRLIQYIQQQFGTTFTDFVEASIAMMLIENWAFLADMLSFKTDLNVNEVFIDSVTQIENAFRIANLVGFQPTPPLPATALFSATMNNLLTTDLLIPAPLPINITVSGTPVTFELFAADQYNNPIMNADIIIQAGNYSNTSIVGVQGQTLTQTFSGDGTTNQSYQLASSPVIYDSVQVAVNGVQWQQVQYFTASQPNQEYLVSFDSSYNAYVMFGNNSAGLIPATGASIVVTYRVGGGSIGNIISNFISTQRNFEVPGFSFAVPVTFTNYTQAQFGYDGDGIEDIRQKLPAYVRTQNRAVTGTDYKTLTDQFVTPYNGQIGKSTAVLRNYGCAGNVIDLFILANNGSGQLTTANDGLKTALQSMLSGVQMLTDYVCLRDGQVILVDVVLDLTVDKAYTKFQDQIQSQVTTVLNNFFAITNWEYGENLKNTDIVKALASIPQIDSTDVSLVTNDPNNSGTLVTAQYYEIIQLDSITTNFNFV